MTEGLSLYLHRIVVSTEHRNRRPRTGPDGIQPPPAVPLDLHYLLTAWAADAIKQQRLLGWAIRVLADTPTLPAGLLNDAGPEHDVFMPEETVELLLEPLSVQDMSYVQETVGGRREACATLLARVIELESIDLSPLGSSCRRAICAYPTRVPSDRRDAHDRVTPLGLRFHDAATRAHRRRRAARDPHHAGHPHASPTAPASGCCRTCPGCARRSGRRRRRLLGGDDVEELRVRRPRHAGALPAAQRVAQAPFRGIFTPSCGSPLAELGAIPLFPGPACPAPGLGRGAGRAARGLGRPAAWALLEVTPEGAPPARGMADARGRAVVLVPYPRPTASTGSPLRGLRRTLASERWPLRSPAATAGCRRTMRPSSATPSTSRP